MEAGSDPSAVSGLIHRPSVIVRRHDLRDCTGCEAAEIEPRTAGLIADNNSAAIEFHMRRGAGRRNVAHSKEWAAGVGAAPAVDEVDVDGRGFARQRIEHIRQHTKHGKRLGCGRSRNQNLDARSPRGWRGPKNLPRVGPAGDKTNALDPRISAG